MNENKTSIFIGKANVHIVLGVAENMITIGKCLEAEHQDVMEKDVQECVTVGNGQPHKKEGNMKTARKMS